MSLLAYIVVFSIPLAVIIAIFIIANIPPLMRSIGNYFRERDEREFWLMRGCVFGEFTEEERDILVKKYIGWSDRRWNNFTKTFRTQQVLAEFIPDIDMLRALK